MSNELSTREVEIVRLMGTGVQNKEIASSLCISVNTVKAHVQTIYEKLDVHNRLRAYAVWKNQADRLVNEKNYAIAEKALAVFRREQKARSAGVRTDCYCKACVQSMQLAIGAALKAMGPETQTDSTVAKSPQKGI